MSVLSDELANDPKKLGYQEFIDSGDNGKIVSLLNEKRYEERGKSVISSSELLIWAGQNSRLEKLKDALDNKDIPSSLRSVVDAALRMIQRDNTNLDLGRPEILGMIDVLTKNDILYMEDRQELLKMSVGMVSRSEQLGLGRVTLNDVRKVTKGIE